jgi:hypothetical protein
MGIFRPEGEKIKKIFSIINFENYDGSPECSFMSRALRLDCERLELFDNEVGCGVD